MFGLPLVAPWNAITQHKRVACGLLAALLIAVAVLVFVRSHRPPVITTQQVAPHTTASEVGAVTLTPNTVEKIVSDPKDKAVIAELLAQLANAKTNATAVVVTSAAETAKGSGRLVVSGPPPEVAVPGATTPTTATAPTPIAVHYMDWRLTFDGDLTTGEAHYALAQTFETVVAMGRQADGKGVAVAQLYELDAQGQRVPVPTTQTVGVFADETVPHWMRALAIQGGGGATRASDGGFGKDAVVVLQWLKHGRTADASGVTYAVLSPALVIGPGVTDIGVLPVSVNLGRLPHQPFSNLWLSPFVAKSQRLGLFVTATF